MRLARIALCVALIASISTMPSVRAASSHDVLFVGNSVAGTVDLFDTSTFTRLGALNIIPEGSTPPDPVQAAIYPGLTKTQGINYVQDIALSPDGETLYVSRGYFGDVAAFSLRTKQELWRVQIQSARADHAELSPDGSKLYVSAITSDVVEVIDTNTHQLIGVTPAGDFPHTLGFSPDGKTLYSGSLGLQPLDSLAPTTPPSQADGRHWLEAIDPNTFLPIRPPCELGAGIRPFAMTPDGSIMYVQLSYYNGIVEYDPVNCKEINRLDLKESGRAIADPHTYPNQAAMHGVALSPDGQWLCLAGTMDDYIALVHAPDLGEVLPFIKLAMGDEPAWATNSPDGQYCFVTARGANANYVSVISYATHTEIARMQTDTHPQTELAASVPDDVLNTGGWL
ncbi:MAG: YncE family protein [Actinomycetota bacterium]